MDLQEIRNRLNKRKQIYFMLLLPVALTAVLVYYPLWWWVIAFKFYALGQEVSEAKWAGFYHFKTFFAGSNNDWIYLFRNTLGMNILSMLANIFGAMTLAILFHETCFKKTAKVVQTVSFFPFFISWVIVYAIVYSLFSVSNGIVNIYLTNNEIIKEPIELLSDKRYSWLLIVLLNTWKSVGYSSIIYLAAISGIPTDQYEAGEIDGVRRFGRIVHITIPNLLPTISVLLILNSGWIFSSNLEQYFLFTNAVNYKTMEVFDMYIYRYGIKLLNYPYAVAVGIIKTFMSIAMIILANITAKRLSGKGIL